MISPIPTAAINNQDTPRPVCPHCGTEQKETWSLPNRPEVELTCTDCKRPFVCAIVTTVSYTTRKK